VKYFRIEEFLCPCCLEGRGRMDQNFLAQIEWARELAGVPFIITSGWRCSRHNERVGGKATSSHLKGLAADIRIDSSRDRFLVFRALLRAGFCRIGIGRDFIHVDTDPDKAHDLIWIY